jgi:small-conductance mechanosensitive channel
MEIQEQLLFTITEIVSRAGTEIAFPSQTMYVANAANEGKAGTGEQRPAPGRHEQP